VVRWTVGGAPQAACGSCHRLPASTGAHDLHASGRSYRVACEACHQDPDWPGRHVNGTVDVQFQAPSGAGTYSGGACANLYCHSDGRGRTRASEWQGSALACSSCHDDETTAAPQMSGQHAFHLRTGILCADCHGSVVNRRKEIIDFALHANGARNVQVLGGRYAGNTCFPGCHDQRSW
jgi:predicted CxxxxCH...CXXCH cytochrome family protein